MDFLTVEEVVDLHRFQQGRFGGSAALRSRRQLEAALAQPGATFEAEYLHDGLFGMAAAYLYYLVRNHPFVDGNERTGLLAALVFLELNGVSLDHDTPRLFELAAGVGEGRLDLRQLGAALEELAGAPPHPSSPTH